MRIGSRQFHFDGQTYVMGILNVTPDSFSDGGLYLDPGKALDYALQMQAEGADLLDIGGESTRPGAESVPSEDEWKRLCPILNPLASRLSIPISVDTRKASVARRALGEGASLINDISALGDPEMAGVLATAQAPVILMHMRGEPGTMQAVPIHYDDVVLEIIEFLEGRMRHAVARGVSPEGILIDPGLGFGKRPEDNWEILKRLQEFCRWNAPVVIGASRKSFVRQKFGVDPGQILEGSVTVAVDAASRGASVVRVHDVKATVQALRCKNGLPKSSPFYNDDRHRRDGG